MIKVHQLPKRIAASRKPLFVLTAFMAGSLLFLSLLGFHNSADAQKRRTRRSSSRPVAKASAIDYSRFSHVTKNHQGACNTCHKVPTDNWKKVRDFPDVADFPGHAACVSCHRPQFFKGAKPIICSICHSKVSPKDDARFAFRNPTAPRQFLIAFPHDKHQDVIARVFPRLSIEELPPFVRASFSYNKQKPDRQGGPGLISQVNPSLTVGLLPAAYSSADDKAKHYNNCEICHSPRATVPTAPPNGWPDSFVPDAATFKDAPRSHAACFNCHWKSQPPTSENCAGCHRLSDKPFVMIDAPSRLSFKFRHAREQHVAECTTCHINITKSSTLRGLKPDVPITACSECHEKGGLRQDVSKELEAIKKNRDFVCAYCHTSAVGRRDPPASHYLIADVEAIKRKDMK